MHLQALLGTQLLQGLALPLQPQMSTALSLVPLSQPHKISLWHQLIGVMPQQLLQHVALGI